MSPQTASPRIVVLGVGNSQRRDDAVGPAVVARLMQDVRSGLLPLALGLHVSDGEPGRLIAQWQGSDLAVIVDAARTRSPSPGQVHRMEAVEDAVQPAATASSHGLGISEAVRLAHVLDRLPVRLIVYGVEIADIRFGSGLSPAVAAAVTSVAERIRHDVLLHHGRGFEPRTRTGQSRVEVGRGKQP